VASILKVDSLQELTANAGIHIVGKITGPSGDLITADGRLSVTRQNINVTEDLNANNVIGQNFQGIQMHMIVPNAPTAGINQVLTADGMGGFAFLNPIEQGIVGYSTSSIDQVINGGKPDSVWSSELTHIDGGGVTNG